MTPFDHLKAAQQDAKALASGNLIPAAKSAIIHDWARNMLSYLKGSR